MCAGREAAAATRRVSLMIVEKSAGRRTLALVSPLLLLMAGACNSESGPALSSGAPSESKIEELSGEQLGELCTWVTGRMNGKSTGCPSDRADAAGSSADAVDTVPSEGQSTAPLSGELCVKMLETSLPGCTVAEYEICVNSSIEDPCGAETKAACDRLEVCRVSSTVPPTNHLPKAGSDVCARENCEHCWVSVPHIEHMQIRECDRNGMVVSVIVSFGVLCGWVDCGMLFKKLGGGCVYRGIEGANLNYYCTVPVEQ